jgi:ubiquinone/menaquinone biosynthesis C-methylase UbiE
MLRIARKKLPDIKFIKGDMRTFNLNKQFDVIVCLFSAIGHLKTNENLNKAIWNFSRHLKPGGVLLFEPFISREQFIDGHLGADFVNERNLKLARMAVGKRKGNIASFNFHFLVGEKGKIKHFTVRLGLAMFDRSRILSMMRNSGLKAKCSKKGLMKFRELYIGVKR